MFCAQVTVKKRANYPVFEKRFTSKRAALHHLQRMRGLPGLFALELLDEKGSSLLYLCAGSC